ncbi:MAG: hypothetical protein A3F84_25265 [Candidatus Handelsmanbacteria bacterium RIFCSPLOWO2_12_FULL_64_10]|uniref:Outer membrane protein beta-barrel domain-containing protein n=1 Tax=Handelsmanbacteria sp. (strain RIFCSPLOWO2_12_FULL_64_10) TaxID=1817868 RepID=A0A1F6CVP0_HANXR|nr:MAG: hypothetical protein A3F84_25265 [Candidatus Handelsmanbacteria bacterium RIFCSPLOWO2_12_FULL_64_10]
MRFLKWGLFAIGLAVLVSDALAAEKEMWGIGGSAGLNVPARQLRDRFGSTTKYGATMNYVMGQATTLEIEYHHSKFDKGKIETMPFTWSVDKKVYTSPNASSTMAFNSLALNALIFPGEENQARGFKAKEYRHYILVGGGFYRYKSVTKNLVYPAQTKEPINLSYVMDPQVDQRYTLAVDVGVGLEGFITDNLSVDVRGRYNIVIGELRPMLFYNINQTWPIMMFDVGVGFKIYFLK